MKQGLVLTVCMAFVLMAADAFAQGGHGGRGGGGKGGGPGGGPGGGNNGPDWKGKDWGKDWGKGDKGNFTADSLDDAASRIGEDKDKIIVFYAYQTDPDLDMFRNNNTRDFADQNTVMVRNKYDKDNAQQKDMGIRTAPTFVGLDRYLNEFGTHMTSIPSGDQFVTFVKAIQAQVKKFEDDLKAASAKAEDAAAKGDEARAIREFSGIVNLGKKGYPEIEAAKAKIQTIADSQFARAKILLGKPETEKDGLGVLEGIIRGFKGLSQALIAELEIARYLLNKGDIGSAMDRLNHVLRADAKNFKEELGKAQDLLASIVTEGINGIRSALMMGVDGNLEAAKTQIKKIKTDYAAAPEVVKHATDVLKDLEK